jgi:hypothetical protein
VINGLRDAIFAIALPTPPAPITSALMEWPFVSDSPLWTYSVVKEGYLVR